jgi:hypothetical protein
MEINKSTASADETIVLYPRSYNKRGEERLHSVQGVTLDGREVNVKLRVDETMLGKETTPSIAEFSREDVKAKTPCLATPENGPDSREGMLLFTGCEVEGENRKGIPTFIARWAYVLASHSEAQTPVYGLGRVVMLADSQATKSIQQELADLEKLKPEGWEAIAERKRLTLGDAMQFSYFGQLYQDKEEEAFAIDNRQPLVEFADRIFTGYTRGGVVGGLLIRLQDEGGAFIPGFSVEVFPRWIRQNTYQAAADVMKFFFRSFDQRSPGGMAHTITAMPIMRYSCGPSFKNYYFQKDPEASLLKIKKRYLINNEPTVSMIAFTLSKREESGDRFMLKYFPLSNPLCSVAAIGEKALAAQPVSEVENNYQVEPTDHSQRPMAGLSSSPALVFAAWYQPVFLEPQFSSQETTNDEVESTSMEQISAPEILVTTTEHTPISEEAAPDTPEVCIEPIQEPVGDEHIAQTDVGVENTVTPPEQASEAVTVAEESDEADLSDMFADVPEDELREAEEATAQILAEVAAEPVVVEDADEPVDQDAELPNEPITAESPASETPSEDAVAPVNVDEQAHIAPETIPTAPVDELRIIDVSTDGEHAPAMETPVPGPVEAEPIESPMQASAGSNLVEVPPITPRVSEPETKKKGLARFFDKQGLL